MMKEGNTRAFGQRADARRRSGIVPALLCAALGILEPTAAHANRDESLLDLGLEDLLQLNVTTASKKEQNFFVTPAAVFVITQEDIRRMGATSVPEALRMVPGMEVARIDSDKWAVSARGFNSRYAGKLLVMIDGRSLYSPSFSGVFWESIDVFLGDVDRIEVIRGPGGAIWGANAVNGVVNIITRPAGQTTGTEGVAALGSLERAALAVRHGGSSAETTNYRVYGKTFRRIGPAALAPDDDERWTSGQVGFRVDGTRGDRDAFSVQGALLGGRIEDTFTSRTSFWPPVVEVVPVTTDWLEHNALARYERNYSEQSAMSVQAYYQVSRQVWEFDARKRLFDVEVQRREVWGARHDFVGGAGYRVSRDRIVPTPTSTVRFANVSQTNYVANAFLQDEIAVVPSRVWFTAGVKAEYNEYTGIEWQPTTRLLYAPNDDVAAWAAVSRAVRTPDRTDRDLRVDFAVIPTESGTPTVLSILGNPDFDSETVVAYETGFRWQHGRRGLIDLTTFFNEYSRLRAAVPVAPFIESEPQPEHLVVAERYANVGHGIGYGSEVVAHWEMTRGWRLTAGYSWLRLELDTDPIASAPGLESVERQSPRHHVTLRSQINLGRSVEWDVSGVRVSELEAFDIPGYTRVDMRVGWTLGGGEELSIGMENMFDAEHYEFGFLDGIEASPVQRNTYARLSFRL